MTKTPAPVSIRLDAETERRLRQLAHATGRTVSSVVREAVAAYGAQHDAQAAQASRPYDRIRHLIGVVDRDGDRSERTGEKFRSVLKANTRARRAR